MRLDSSSRGIGYPGGGWTIRLPMSSITRLEAKRFDAWSTVGLVAAGVATSWLGWEALGGGSGDNGPPDGSPPVERSRTVP